MRGLKELQRVIVDTLEDGNQVSRLPNNEEIMNKINEVIRYINYLEKTKQNVPVKGR